MVRNYVRKTERQQWNVSNMQREIGAMKTGKMGFERAARSHNVPKTTLRRRVLGMNTILQNGDKGFVGGYRRVFSEDQERELANHVLHKWKSGHVFWHVAFM